jgi:NAD kinase
MGSNGATAQGSKIFERLNKVILASVCPVTLFQISAVSDDKQWENIVTRKSAERTSLVQAAVIGQTFAYLSGVRFLKYVQYHM